MRPGTTSFNLHSKAVKRESRMQTCTREGVEPEGKAGGEHGPFGETPLEALTCPPVGLACSPFHTLNLPLRQPLPFPCLWEPKKVSRAGQGFTGDSSLQVLFLPHTSPAAGLQTTRKMEGWDQYLSARGECKHRGWVSWTSGGALLRRSSAGKRQLKQATLPFALPPVAQPPQLAELGTPEPNPSP